MSTLELPAHLRALADNMQASFGGVAGEGDKAAEVVALRAAAARIEQLESATRIAYGQVRYYRKEVKRAWDGSFVSVVCEAALKGEPEPGDDWREKLRAQQSDGSKQED